MPSPHAVQDKYRDWCDSLPESAAGHRSKFIAKGAAPVMPETGQARRTRVPSSGVVDLDDLVVASATRRIDLDLVADRLADHSARER